MSQVDTDRLEQLVDEHAPQLYRFVVGLTSGQAQTAEDVVQETMVRMWRNLDALPPDHEGVRRWLFTVARRLVIDSVRKRQSRPAEVSATLAERVPNHDDTAAAAIANFALREAFRGLGSRHKFVLTEVYLRHRSVEEVADELQIPEGTVRSRIHYALRSLRTAVVT
jgi:RNA polymerase sigma-70 factor (ECF subfamily)